MMWVEKYRPDNPAKIVGNEEARADYLKWLKSWKMGSPPALLIGPPGVGKTTLVYAAANILGYRVIELNASDVRTRDRLQQILGPSLSSTSILGEKQLIFLDEVDGLYARQDYGGLEFIYGLIEKSPIPVVMAANVEEDEKVKKLLAKSKVMRFKRVPLRLVEMYLRDILRKEGIEFDSIRLEEIVKLSKGDVRAAINTLQASTNVISTGVEALAARDSQLSLREAVELFFSAQSQEEAIEAMIRCDAQPDEKVRAFYTSIVSSGLQSEDLIRLLEALSKADELVKEIRKTQEWRLLRYFNEVLAYNLYQALPKGLLKYSEQSLPWNVQLRIWNDARVLRNVGLKLKELFHVSSKEARLTYLPYLLLGKDKKEVNRIGSLLGLDPAGIRVLEKEAERVAQKVMKS